jgi:hypothetical protein
LVGNIRIIAPPLALSREKVIGGLAGAASYRATRNGPISLANCPRRAITGTTNFGLWR